jgi:voltage-gated potassium channel
MIPLLLTLYTFIKVFKKLIKDPKFRSSMYVAFLTLAIGTVFYHNVEGWEWLDSLYFCVITLATIGYGDFVPTTNLGKAFTIIYVFIGIGILISFIDPIGEIIVQHREEKVEKRREKQQEKEKQKESERESK